MRVGLVLCFPLLACGDPTITDPCPGQRTCPGEVCCDEQYPYNCGDQCYTTPCGPTQVTCIHVDLTDGCYGGKWSGTISGTGSPGGNVTFTIFEKTITASLPAGLGNIDCSTGAGSWTSTSGTTTYTFHGTFRHTDDQGDRISNATWAASGSGATGSGTWDALRIE
jgi:hypothetical protein